MRTAGGAGRASWRGRPAAAAGGPRGRPPAPAAMVATASASAKLQPQLQAPRSAGRARTSS